MDPPASRSRLEINFIRLLEETQQMANGNKQKDWTFEKYIGWLQEKIPEMEKSPNAPNDETLKHYKRQVDFLRGVLEAENCTQVLDSGTATQMIPHGPATTSNHSLTQQIHQRAQAKTTNRLRQDLLGLDPNGDEREFRNRKGGLSGDISAEDFQSQLLSDEQKREKMVEDMIIMTREWKEQSKITNKIIKKDIDVWLCLSEYSPGDMPTDLERKYPFITKVL
ncbi:Vesicle transport protein USE1-like [Homarus americanus]|uniref:Vesicle transport protein USE1 n=1 Tax=Homarus americanus TaxID=6706 RepID=A0A8J5MM35_HOMAM|nr:Vesicle transport protein USE1-like [Homarus americanus]